MMNQVVHIFKKDARRFLSEMLVVAVAALFFALFQNHETDQLIANPNPQLGKVFEIIFVILAVFVIVNVIQEDRIPGDTQFWLTRPYLWSSLLAAKALFILVFVNGPAFIAQIAIAHHAGFSWTSSLVGSLWLQVLLLVMVELPLVCIAAVTSSLKQFFFSLIAVTTPVFLFWISRFKHVPDEYMSAPFSVDWIGWTVAAAILGIAAFGVACFQYSRRRSMVSRVIGVAAWVSAMTIALVGTSWELTAQTFLSSQPALASDVRLDSGASHAEMALVTPFVNTYAVQFSNIAIAGIPEGYDLRGDAVFAEVRWPDGETHTSANGRVWPGAVEIPIFLTRELYDRERTQQATVRISAYLTLFGNPHTDTVSLGANPSTVTDNMSCFIASDEQRRTLGAGAPCFAVFRTRSNKLIRASMSEIQTQFREGIPSYSPFPAELVLNPVLFRWEMARPGQRIPLGSVATITSQEAVAHFKREATLQFRLADVPVVRYSFGF